MAVATSLEHLTPNPMCPLESPIAKTYSHKSCNVISEY